MAEHTSTTAAANPQPNPARVAKRITRFWAKVDQSAGPSACWPWTGGARSEDGYGAGRNTEGRQEAAHRIALRLSGVEVRKNAIVRHKVCDNPVCCNPAHLMVGSHADNVADRVEAGRSAKGERHGRAKLNSVAVAAIKQLSVDGWPGRSIAVAFGVHESTVGLILRGVNWQEAEQEE